MAVISFGGALMLIAATFGVNKLSSAQAEQMQLLRQLARAEAAVDRLPK